MIYQTKGVCSKSIEFEITDGIVHNVKFVGGCAGNTVGIAKLVEGMKASEVIEKLKGTKCGFKNTSCPDQLSIALKQYLETQN